MKFGNCRIRHAGDTPEVQAHSRKKKKAEAAEVDANPGKTRAEARQHGMQAYAPTERRESETEDTIERHIAVSIYARACKASTLVMSPSG